MLWRKFVLSIAAYSPMFRLELYGDMLFIVFFFLILSWCVDWRMEASGRPSTAQIVLLATSSALTAVLYTIYKKKSSHVARLRVRKQPLCVSFNDTSTQRIGSLLNLTCVTGGQEDVIKSRPENYPQWSTRKMCSLCSYWRYGFWD